VGAPGNPFEFQVVYSDLENDAPTFSGLMVLAPGSEFPDSYLLTSDDTDYTDGSLFSTELVLTTPGQYQIGFTFMNSSGQSCFLPGPGEYLPGPMVQELSGVTGAPAATTALFPAVPNPANPGTVLSWSLQAAGDIQLAIYDMAGRRLRDLYQGPAAAGPGEVFWDGKDGAGRGLASGVYLARLTIGDPAADLQVISTKVMLVR
jgi:hypothetical protein